MSTYKRPGVYTTETLAGPITQNTTSSPSTGGFMGESLRGPTQRAFQCNSWSDYVRYFGGFNKDVPSILANPYLPYGVYSFFANGGNVCWVQRIANSSTSGGTVVGATAFATLLDSAATGQPTLNVYAYSPGVWTASSLPPATSNPGVWGNRLYVTVTPGVIGGTPTGRFNLTVLYGGNTPAFTVETWTDLSMVNTDPRYAPRIINDAVQGSAYITGVDMLSSSGAPNNSPMAVTAQLSSGTDPSSVANANPTPATDYTNALTYGSAPFDKIPGVLNFALPGCSTSAYVGPAGAYASARPGTFLAIDTAIAQTPAAAISATQALGANVVGSSYNAVYYPWLVCSDASSSSLQATITLPPSGAVIGQMAATDTAVGVWKAPAGIQNVLANVVQSERLLSNSDLDSLNVANVNALKTLPNGQVVIFGARTQEYGYASLYVPVRRTLNYIESSLTDLVQFAVFQPNDALLWTQISASCSGFLAGLWGQNAFPGTTSAKAYYVICDDTNNTSQTIAQGLVQVTVGVALLIPAEFVVLNITQFQNSGATTVTTSAA